MKINELYGSQILGKTANKSAKPAGGADFRTMLDSRLQAVDEPAGTSTVSAVTDSRMPSPLRIEGLALTENTIDTLETFGQALQNRNLSISDLEPFVSALEDDTSSILALKEQMPGEDPLAQLLERVATVSYLEAAKFRRGDYSA